MKRLLFIPLLFTLGCPAMELPEEKQQKLDEHEEFEKLADDYARQITQNLPVKEVGDKQYYITDKNGKQFTLSPSRHLTLFLCETYKNLFTDCGQADFSNQYAPASATKENILAFINYLETKSGPLACFELANYLEAPEETIAHAAQDYCSHLYQRNKNTLSTQEKVLKKIAKEYLFYENFTEFIKDYEHKFGKCTINATNDFSHKKLKSLGLVKKIKSLEGLEQALSDAQTFYSRYEDSKISINLSGHAIDNFHLKDFFISQLNKVFDTIDLRKNKITKLCNEQINYYHYRQYITLLLDRNPIKEICRNLESYPSMKISLKGIAFSKEMLKQLPKTESLLEWLSSITRKYSLHDSHPAINSSAKLIMMCTFPFFAPRIIQTINHYLIKMGKNGIDPEIAPFSLPLLRLFLATMPAYLDKLEQFALPESGVIETDYGIHFNVHQNWWKLF